MLELGLMSLDRRDPAEEMLPAVIEREWTEPVLTGFYDSVGTTTAIPIDELTPEAAALSWCSTVASEAAVLSINQAGEHLEGYWHERQFDPASSRPVRLVEWFAAGDRDRSRSGLVYDMVWISGDDTLTGTYTFREVGSALEVTADWGPTLTFRRRDLPQPVFEPGEDESVQPPAVMVRAYWTDAEIDALPGELRDGARLAERYSLHPSEIVLLDAIVARVTADLEGLAQRWGPGSTPERIALCTNLANAFAYFVRGGNLSEHAPTARHYVLAALMSMGGNNTPIDEWTSYAPQTYFHALAKAHQEFHCPNDDITACLGVDRELLEWFASDQTYQFRFHTSLSSDKALRDFTLGEVTEQLVKKLAEKGVLIGTKVMKVVSVGPSPQYDTIEAEIQKLGPYPDAAWPGNAAQPISVWYDGVLIGGAISASVGMSASSSTEWTTINALGDRWTPDDFAGWLWIAGLFWGLSVFGLETKLLEDPVNWVLDKLGQGPARVSGDISYTKFTAPPKADVWTICRGFTNSFGLHAELGANVTAGKLGRRGQQPDLSEVLPDVAGGPRQITAVSFDVGRSELTAAGAGLLRQAAADRLRQLASPSTTLEVVGHASFGDARPLYNLILSQRRAANVVRALQAYLGPLYAVHPERTAAVGLGDQQAAEDGGPPEQWRRVDVFINGDHAVRLATGAP